MSNNYIVRYNPGWLIPPPPRPEQHHQGAGSYWDSWSPRDEWPSGPPRQPEPPPSPEISFYARYMMDTEEAHYRANLRTLHVVEDEVSRFLSIYAIINYAIPIIFVAIGFFFP
jgi:hypothetical protein